MQNKPQKKIRSGKSRVEYNNYKEEILAMLYQGYTLTAVHSYFVSQKKITMSYVTLSKLVQGKMKYKYNINNATIRNDT